MREKRESPTKHSGFDHYFLKRKDGKSVNIEPPKDDKEVKGYLSGGHGDYCRENHVHNKANNKMVDLAEV